MVISPLEPVSALLTKVLGYPRGMGAVAGQETGDRSYLPGLGDPDGSGGNECEREPGLAFTKYFYDVRCLYLTNCAHPVRLA